MRAGIVSIEEILEACFRKSLMMRTRPRLSGYAAKCVGKRVARGLQTTTLLYPLPLVLPQPAHIGYHIGHDKTPTLQYSSAGGTSCR